VIRINLAPPRQRGRPALRLPQVNLGVLIGVAVLIIALGLGVWSWSLLREEQRLAHEIELGARELTGLNAIVGPAAKMKERLADLEARLKAIRTLTKDQSRSLFLIDAFADAVPGDLWITGLEDSGTALRVTGAAFSYTAVSDLMSALRSSGRFKDIDIVLHRRDLDRASNMVTFEVTCRFDG
jgi:Tfp pilus assembly protein PilN